MAEAAKKTGKGGKGGIAGFLAKDTAGLPNWAWLIIVGAGLAAAYIVPKFFGNSSTPADNPSGASSTDSTGTNPAIDPTTGLPWSTDNQPGLPVPGPAGPPGPPAPSPIEPAAPGQPTPPVPASPPTPPVSKPECPKLILSCRPGETMLRGVDANGCPTATCKEAPPKQPPKSTPRYVIVQKWPNPLSTLSSIAQKYGITLARLEQLNPSITNPNLIYPGQRVRIA